MSDKKIKEAMTKASDVVNEALQMLDNVQTVEDYEQAKNKISELKAIRDSID